MQCRWRRACSLYCWTGVVGSPLIAVLDCGPTISCMLTLPGQKQRRAGRCRWRRCWSPLGCWRIFGMPTSRSTRVNQIGQSGDRSLNIGTVLPLSITIYLQDHQLRGRCLHRQRSSRERNSALTFACICCSSAADRRAYRQPTVRLADQLHDGLKTAARWKRRSAVPSCLFSVWPKSVASGGVPSVRQTDIGVQAVGPVTLTPLAWLALACACSAGGFDFHGCQQR